MVVSKSVNDKPECNSRIGNEEIEEKDSFNYLGSLVTSDAKCKKDIRMRISIAKEKFQDMRSIFTNRNCHTWTESQMMRFCVGPMSVVSYLW